MNIGRVAAPPYHDHTIVENQGEKNHNIYLWFKLVKGHYRTPTQGQLRLSRACQ